MQIVVLKVRDHTERPWRVIPREGRDIRWLCVIYTVLNSTVEESDSRVLTEYYQIVLTVNVFYKK